ncbi:MAG: hypothetical protein ACXVCY_10605 [Pseudobdellovibrionaceae bacterium]
MMTLTNLHLILNHVTIVGVPVAAIFLLHSFLRGNVPSRQFALVILFLVSIVVLPVYFTGEPAEETVEHLPGVIESIIETHQDAGKVSMIVTVLLGVVSFGALWFQKDERKGRTLDKIIFALAVITTAVLAYTGSLGGKIRHTELRSDAAAYEEQNKETNNEKNE